MSKTKPVDTAATEGATLPDLQAQLEAEAQAAAKMKADQEAAAEADSVKAREDAQLALEKEEVAKRQDKAAAVVTEEARLAAAQEQVAADAAERAKAGKRRYRSVFGHMIDPDTQKEFNTDDETKSELTSWLKYQIDNGKIVEADED